ncbi:MAG TPA: 50S ribosomal protein L34e [Candidatus Bathyarchaeia archaeon]|nr:50S ribosomal protein L34e [Candidatus Bathyarchaeia archaeon]
MPRRSLRVRKTRRQHLRLPGGRRSIHYSKRALSSGRCSSCGIQLGGVPASNSRGISKSGRRPTRPFGGMLCHNCLREKVRQEARVG